ncbi:MAG: hypothetical protein ACREM3_23200 [Candidatus Rokuibacteriota bacterium]
MPPWAQAVIVLCVVAVTVALIPALLAIRRAAERSERVLAVAERDLAPLGEHLKSLVDEFRSLSRDARAELGRVAELTDRAEEVATGIGRVLTAVSGLTRAGQLVGVAAGLKTGLDVFLHRLRKQEGDHHE